MLAPGLELPLILREALDQSFCLWKPQFTHLKNGNLELSEL